MTLPGARSRAPNQDGNRGHRVPSNLLHTDRRSDNFPRRGGKSVFRFAAKFRRRLHANVGRNAP